MATVDEKRGPHRITLVSVTNQLLRLSTASLPTIFGIILFVSLAIVASSGNHLLHLYSQYDALPTSSFRREYNNLVYWTPHKTGSGSLREWLKTVSSEYGFRLQIRPNNYSFADFTDWYTHSRVYHDRYHGPADQPINCGIIAGHIRIIPVEDRIHEGVLGAVVSTTRDARDTMASKFFHRNRLSYRDHLPSSVEFHSFARTWFFYFHDLDPCEQLRYYDGHEGCDLDTVSSRIRNIVDRIDCTINTDDADADLEALCRMMKLKQCPEFPSRHKKVSSYSELFQVGHIREAMDNAVNVGKLLNAEMLKKGCRYLDKGNELVRAGVEPPRFPSTICAKHSSRRR